MLPRNPLKKKKKLPTNCNPMRNIFATHFSVPTQQLRNAAVRLNCQIAAIISIFLDIPCNKTHLKEQSLGNAEDSPCSLHLWGTGP